MIINRLLQPEIESKLSANKAILIMGARQTGKTTLIKSICKNREDVLWLNGDEPDVRSIMENITSTRFKAIIGNKNIVVIDEAQRINNIGLSIKLIIDQIPNVRVIASGSSSFELANRVNEPLTGRKWEYKLFPLSFSEMAAEHGILEEKRLLPHRLVFGSYPEVVTNPGDEKELLLQLADSYLYRDVLTLEQVKRPDKLVQLMQALAYQAGSQVSYSEVGQKCGLDSKTVEKYIILMEQAYVLFRLSSFSRNLRNELTTSRKIYFTDNGIRNALIANFSHVENRADIGALWENYLVSERVKYLRNNGLWANYWFWRTQQQQEIDYLEESEGALKAYEFKWNPNAKAKFPKTFASAYPGAAFQTVHRDNIEEFLM